jgi:hypothetical protein
MVVEINATMVSHSVIAVQFHEAMVGHTVNGLKNREALKRLGRN